METSISRESLARYFGDRIAIRVNPRIIVCDDSTEFNLQEDVLLESGETVETGFHSARQIDTESICRKLQWQIPRYLPKSALVQDDG